MRRIPIITIDGEEVGASDIIRKADSTETYQIGSGTARLEGVYNINKGYAIFKQIDILYQNEGIRHRADRDNLRNCAL